MMPVKGQFVQVRFNNGVFFEGFVQEWSDKKSVLRLLENDDIVIIQKTLQDVLLVKIIQQDPIKKKEHQIQLQYDYETLKKEPKTDHSLQQLAVLKDELNKIEREEILTQARSNKLNNTPKEISYALPRNIHISRSSEHSSQEITTENSDFNSELQRMFK